MVLYTLTSLPMMPRPGTQALVVSRADKIYISALFASSLVRNNIFRVNVLLYICFRQYLLQVQISVTKLELGDKIN